MSQAFVADVYYASYFTEPFKFGDVYIGICAKKMNLEPFESKNFLYGEGIRTDARDEDFSYIIAAHGYENPKQLMSFWLHQKAAGNA